jgi:D-beta-D-heptose 7-phosphate kinase / D-beta-D-heptose 1-phosphate adenosyltransferase
MLDFETLLKSIAEQTVICIGDLMLDDFVYGEVSRISPEAPAPVIAVKRNEQVIGGAGNVARNIASLGARCVFVGVVGDDDTGRSLERAFAAFGGLIEPNLVVDGSRPTTRKVRFVSEHFSTHLLRADWEDARPVSANIEAALIARVTAAIPRAGAVVLSDYAKGALTAKVIRAVIDAARKLEVPVIVDPKASNFAIYRGATLITPNRKELAEATRHPVSSDAELAAAAAELARIAGSEAVLVTLSEDGMMLHVDGADAVHVPAYPVRVRDVSGAGDTVVAVLATLLARGIGFEAAMRAANAAASVVVGKRGTATVSVAELRSRLLPAAALASEEKIAFDWAVADDRVGEWRRQGLRIGFTNGCFDILHPGHVRLLAQARAACDRLVVGLNGDASVRRLKGETRPIQDVHARADVLAALEAVDLVVVFDQDTPRELIARLRPKVLVKGGDYTLEEVVGHDLVEADGGEVILVELVPGHSTTGIVKRSAERPGLGAAAESTAKRVVPSSS